MKTIKISIAAIAFAAGVALSSCEDNQQRKIENAREDVMDAQVDLEKEKQELRDTYDEAFRENERTIGDLRTRVRDADEKDRDRYTVQIDELETRNRDMRTRLNDYSDNTRAGWDNFKREFNRDMDELGQALRNITVDNVRDNKTDVNKKDKNRNTNEK